MAKDRRLDQGCVALYPAIAEAAWRVGADAVGLVDVGCSSRLDLQLDRVGITYGDGPVLGDPSSPVQLASSIVGDRPIPARAMPAVVARVGVGAEHLDVTDADVARRLRAESPTDQPDVVARLDAELGLTATSPPALLDGDPVELLPDAIARVPDEALPVVMTTWALSSFSLERRLRFLRRLDDVALDRTVVWASVEGVGVAPGVPTLGDRPASGHSIVGLAVFEQSAMRIDVVGRCWSRGRWVSWLVDA